MLIDTHCHLDAAEFAPDRVAVAARALTADVQLAVVPAVAVDNFAAVAALAATAAAELDGLRIAPAYGIHPLHAQRLRNDDLNRLAATLERALAGPHPPVAVGEIGLDGFVAEWRTPEARARQEALCLAQLQLARDFRLPIILHIRRAQDEVLKLLRRVFGKGGQNCAGGIAHAFNGSEQQAAAFLDLGLRLGFGGTLTYPGSQRIRRLAATLPAAALVLETDAPDIPPAFAPRGRNEPAYLAATAAVLAELRGLTPTETADLTSANARAALPGLQAYLANG